MRQKQRVFSLFLLSPSSRRAWIEIHHRVRIMTFKTQSPSSRRAWIEMAVCVADLPVAHVALLAEGVDRNKA